jgi:hypothetical protein
MNPQDQRWTYAAKVNQDSHDINKARQVLGIDQDLYETIKRYDQKGTQIILNKFHIFKAWNDRMGMVYSLCAPKKIKDLVWEVYTEREGVNEDYNTIWK